MNILRDFSPNIEVYSIDESFLDLTGFENFNYDNYATKIRSRILKWTGIPTCVGVAPTKALSKVANKIARSNLKQSKGICVIDSEEKRIKALKWTKIGKVWGIGSRLQKRLEAKGIVTAYDFTQLPSDLVLKEFSIVEWRLQKDLQGISKIPLEDAVSSKKMIATTRSFEFTYSDIDNIKERISTFAASCAEKLRKQESSCHLLIVQLSSDRHKTEMQQHRESTTVVFSYPTDSTLTISNAAVAAVKTIFKSGVKYKRAGVIVTGVVPNDNFQLNLFSSENPKHKPLMSAIDKLNKKFKSDKIKLVNQYFNRTWKMRQERLSKKFTTNINEIIIVNSSKRN
jgi:DNA polymerase V